MNCVQIVKARGRRPRPKLTDGIRTRAWFHAVARAAGSESVDQIWSKVPDTLKESWYKYQKGRVTPDHNTVSIVENEFPGTRGVLTSGPQRTELWQALWGRLEVPSMKHLLKAAGVLAAPGHTSGETSSCTPYDLYMVSTDNPICQETDSPHLAAFVTATCLYRWHDAMGSESLLEWYRIMMGCLRLNGTEHALNAIGVKADVQTYLQNTHLDAIYERAALRDWIECFGLLASFEAPLEEWTNNPLNYPMDFSDASAAIVELFQERLELAGLRVNSWRVSVVQSRRQFILS